MAERKRYFIVGLGSRADMFLRAMLVDYAERATVVGFCDPVDKGLPSLGHAIHHVLGDRTDGSLGPRAGVRIGLHAHQVDQTCEFRLFADRQRYRHHFLTEAFLESIQDLGKIRALPVHHVHCCQA